MDFAYSARTRDLEQRLLTFMYAVIHPNEAVYASQVASASNRWESPPVMEELKTHARAAGLWNLFSTGERARRRVDQPRIRAAVRDPGAVADRAGSLQLLCAGHRQHGDAGAVRDRRPTGEMAHPAARGSYPIGLRDDRAGGRFVGRHQHQGANRTRRRPLRGQRAQVVGVRRRRHPLQDLHPHGQDGPHGGEAPATVDDSRAGRRAGCHPGASVDGVRLRPRAARAFRGHVRRRPRAGGQPAAR